MKYFNIKRTFAFVLAMLIIGTLFSMTVYQSKNMKFWIDTRSPLTVYEKLETMFPSTIAQTTTSESLEAKQELMSTKPANKPVIFTKNIETTTLISDDTKLTTRQEKNPTTQQITVETTNLPITTESSTTTKTTTKQETTTTTTQEVTTTKPILTTEKSLPWCASPETATASNPNFTIPSKTEDEIAAEIKPLEFGGLYTPDDCLPKYKIAIVIPFRNRDEHLVYYLQYMHPIFQRKNMNYQIFVINQHGDGPFNRAKLMNVGFAESVKKGFDCFVFHDVDMILENDECPIECNAGPVHLGLYLKKWDYKPKVGTAYMGGVAQFSKDQFIKINGMSNSFWGWGGEDDDVFYRTKFENLKVQRYQRCRYMMIKHGRDKGNTPNPKRFDLLKKKKENYKQDGLNTLNYKIISKEERSLFTKFTVDLLGPPAINAAKTQSSKSP